jgi:2-dehydro-3-deoxyglucarate aldolase
MTGVENIEMLASHPTVDAVMVGPYDLSGSLGIPGQLSDKRVVKACDAIIRACKRHGISCGMHAVYPDLNEVRRHFDQGFTFLVLGSDIFHLWKRSEEVDQIIDALGEV